MTREEKIIAYMRSPGYVPLCDAELATVLDVPKSDLGEFFAMLDGLIADGQIVQNKKGRLKASNTEKLTGKFKATRRGGFVESLDKATTVYVPESMTKNAIEGDIVVCRVLAQTKRGRSEDKPEAEICEILRHTLTHIIGTAVQYGGYAYAEPDDANIGFAVRLDTTLGAKAGDKVVVRIDRYPGAASCAVGTVTEILGTGGKISTEIAAISHKAGLRTEFSEAVLAQANAAAETPITADERTDFRQKTVITIDGDDSKDFDDAVCVEKTSDGYILYVHIADVTHYVTAGSPLDREAYLRGTSVYYPGSVIPMLPEQLSNGICSLNPHEDRYTLSVTMHTDEGGNVTDYKIENGIIRSAYRMTYRKVTEILENPESPLREEYKALLPMLLDMHALAGKLTKKRQARGSIEFNLPEPHIVLDGEQNPIAVGLSETGISNKIIEEFMLLANETVAKYAQKKNLPFVYRIHETPSADKMEALNAFLGYMGLPALHTKGEPQPKDFAALVDAAEATDNPALICTITLRSMMKARYSEENAGHFGLAAQDYCHFTSPIRRYPDLFIHRVLKMELAGKLDQSAMVTLAEQAKEAALQSTETEIAAVDAEREVNRLLICHYMQAYVGQEFEAVISSVTDFGMFVTVGGAIDGLVPLSALEDDYYVHDAAHYCIRGERTRRVFALGDTIAVKLVLVSPEARRIDFAPVGMKKSFKKPYEKMLETKKKADKSKAKSKGKTKKFVKKRR